MGPIELGIIVLVILLLFGGRLLPSWGSAIGETLGYVERKLE